MTEQERRILFKIKPALQSETVADAVDIEYDNANRIGLAAGADNIQTVINRIDATGIGAAVTYTGNFEATQENRDIWFGGSSFSHLQQNQEADAINDFTLPSTTLINSALDELEALGLPEVFSLQISHAGGVSSSLTTNLTRIISAAGGPGLAGGRLRIIITLGETITFQIIRTNAVLSAWEIISQGSIQQAGVDSPDDVELQPITWNAGESAALPLRVKKGYAYRVINAPGDGSGRFGEAMQAGDWVVWFADMFTGWEAEPHQWFVIAASDVRRITNNQSNFLQATSEFDNRVDIGFLNPITMAVVWIAPAPLLTAPFINPVDDTSNPREGSDLTYVGGENSSYRDSENQFVFGENRFNSFLYVGISPTGFNNTTAERQSIDIVMTGVDGDVINRFNLDSDFVQLDDASFTNATYIHFALGTSSTQLTTFGYGSLTQIAIIRTEIQRHFMIDPNRYDALENIPDAGIGFEKLSARVNASINSSSGIDVFSEAKLDGLETSAEAGPIPGNTPVMFRYGSVSAMITDYSMTEAERGIVPMFENTRVTVLLPQTVTLTGITRSSGFVSVSDVLGLKAYEATLQASVGDNPLEERSFLQGTNLSINLSGAAPTFKADYDNLSPDIINRLNHPPLLLPEPLKELNNNADVFRLTNTFFQSSDTDVAIGSTWALLKNQPDGSDGSPTYPLGNIENALSNEITNSDVTVTPPDNLAAIEFVNVFDGETNDRLSVSTGGVLTGAGINGAVVTIETPDPSNFRMVFGCWFDVPNIENNRVLLSIKDHDSDNQVVILRARFNALVARTLASPGGTTTRETPHTVYTNGRLSAQFSGTGSLEASWDVDLARTYTVSVDLTANDVPEGTATFDYVVSDINAAQASQKMTLTFPSSSPHTQDINISYVPSTTVYGGTGHTIRIGVDQLEDNSSFDIDHLTIRIMYTTTDTIPLNPTFSGVNASAGQVTANRLHRIIGVLRTDDGTSSGNLILRFVFGGYDSEDRFTIFDENEIMLNYPASILDYSRIQFGYEGVFVQNIQGYFLNTDTPASQFPTGEQLRDLMMFHDNKEDDFLWNKVSAPNEGVEVVNFPTSVSINRIIDVDGKRFGEVFTDNGNGTASIVYQEIAANKDTILQ